MGCCLVALDLDDDFLEQRPQQLLPVTRHGRCRAPDGSKIGSECEQAVALVLGESARGFPLAARSLAPRSFERAQAFLPLPFEPAGNKPVVGIDGAIAAFGTVRLVARPLDAEAPLLCQLPGALRVGSPRPNLVAPRIGAGSPLVLQFVTLHRLIRKRARTCAAKACRTWATSSAR
jgi:hypothetical protein